MNTDDLQVIIERLSDEDGGGYLATVPELPGCMSDGDTRVEALLNVQDAIAAWRQTAKAMGRVVKASREYAHH